ncbi:MAG: hypothetical protein AB1916_11730 [Thermodesulfobacteriota bacterium]
MDLIRRVLLPLVGVFAACLLLGCVEAAPNRVAQQAAPGPAPFVRAEHLCANLEKGKTDLAAVKKDLAALLTNVDGKMLAATNNGDYVITSVGGATDEWITVINDAGFWYSGLLNLRLDYISPAKVAGEKGYPHGAQVWNVVGLYFANEDRARCVAQELFFIQGEQRRKYEEGAFAGFEPLAAAYRAEKVKPQVPEEQRRYIVQANSWAEQKNFSMALTTYAKVLEINPVTYPAAYYNMALMHAQEKRTYEAIVSMKKYLLLVPEAQDARAAQDKIYEWEGIAGVR